MFFAFAAFCVSVATFMLMYKDGKLVDNASTIFSQTRQTLDKMKEERLTDDAQAQRRKISEQLERYAGMIHDGDGQARFYLDNLRTDLERLREYSSDESRKWLDEASKTVEQARDQLREDAPAAARKLRGLANELAGKVEERTGRDGARPAVPAESPGGEGGSEREGRQP
jgi:ABC-type transporter Mla subunit MlaD